jgi:hypothetical protein
MSRSDLYGQRLAKAATGNENLNFCPFWTGLVPFASIECSLSRVQSSLDKGISSDLKGCKNNLD